MADDNNSETETNKESGYWKEVENKEVIKRIAEIDKELDNYSTLKSKVDALATALEQCNLHLSKVSHLILIWKVYKLYQKIFLILLVN